MQAPTDRLLSATWSPRLCDPNPKSVHHRDMIEQILLIGWATQVKLRRVRATAPCVCGTRHLSPT